MPIYEYRCRSCGDFEETQRITDPPLSRCPHCGGKVRRLISQTSFVLKGSGWYATDYARSGGGDKREEQGKKDGGAPGSANGKGAKPAEGSACASASSSSASDSSSGSSSSS